MISVKTLDQNETGKLSSQQVLPADTYPQNYIHSVFNNPQDAAEAIQALQTVGYDVQNIYFLQSQDYIRAVAQRDPQPEGFFSGLIRMFSTFDHDFEDVYMNETYIANERLCCPFLHFTVEIEPHGGPFWLRLTGGEGVKEYIWSLLK
ncbi:MAG: hypothetical protein H0V70_07050 [Ktedonobacteraceae bacterium]|nr:hypothetical protein [Ktedonobacteraceae bacterium]